MLLDRRLQNPKMSCKTNRMVAPATKTSTSSIVLLGLGPGPGAGAGAGAGAAAAVAGCAMLASRCSFPLNQATGICWNQCLNLDRSRETKVTTDGRCMFVVWSSWLVLLPGCKHIILPTKVSDTQPRGF